ncbi:hypothetical protein [Janthinobacterium sp. 17J80-10]|uniref:hypothetical protein n=1 Tax=Janthinobacterium sp. 17J80-10 TaxID=2497863 RepID=UPI001F508F16|nr:hypothetical protein [Janthinobacterium sp. 17J80-10]
MLPQKRANGQPRPHDVGKSHEPVNGQRITRQRRGLQEKRGCIGGHYRQRQSNAAGTQQGLVDKADNRTVQARQDKYANGKQANHNIGDQAVASGSLKIAQPQQHGDQEACWQRNQVRRQHHGDLCPSLHRYELFAETVRQREFNSRHDGYNLFNTKTQRQMPIIEPNPALPHRESLLAFWKLGWRVMTVGDILVKPG